MGKVKLEAWTLERAYLPTRSNVQIVFHTGFFSIRNELCQTNEHEASQRAKPENCLALRTAPKKPRQSRPRWQSQGRNGSDAVRAGHLPLATRGGSCRASRAIRAAGPRHWASPIRNGSSLIINAASRMPCWLPAQWDPGPFWATCRPPKRFAWRPRERHSTRGRPRSWNCSRRAS